MKQAIGIDIGGTKIAIGLVQEDGTLVHSTEIETPTKSRDAVLSAVVDQVKQHAHTASAIGIGSAGQIDVNQGIIRSGTDNITDWNNVPICEYIQQQTNLPTYVDNDVHTFLLAEKGAHKNVLALTLGTGIGGAAYIGGQLLSGEWGGASEFGHMSVNFNGEPCNCGGRGCVEQYASGIGIHKRYLKAGGEATHAGEIFSRALAGEKRATRIIDEAEQALSTAIVSLIHCYNPSHLILGGSVATKQQGFISSVMEQVSQRGMSSLVKPVTYHVSQKEYAGVIGAGLLAFEREGKA
ncbi:ROK family protein [Paenalkalicoccus suaedae]|uniref:ROK family protein n=1 Tax=Paenalkalicoccus suaedae TaxID=2592382 RepID=A0A859FJ44_9BACI|nr:ROK family protein [Paenalkalicoccus suaedae]QKS72852.1 ROK family protein [Paenalkalicoccus suaedae]